MKDRKSVIWLITIHELLPTDDRTNSIRISKTISIIKPLRRVVKIIDNQIKLVSKGILKLNSIRSNGNLWRVPLNQRTKLGKR